MKSLSATFATVNNKRQVENEKELQKICSDIDGRFELKDLKEGNQRLVISYIFYRTAEIDGEVKAENPELNIGLELDGQQLSEVTVIGRKNLESVAALQM